MKKKPLVINLIGGPGLFYALKKLQVNAELSLEWVKNKVYEESFHCMDDQIYIFAKQHHKLFVLQDKVDVVVTDCPLLNSLVYGERRDSFDAMVMDLFNEFNNLNIVIRRKQKYVTDGRIETAEEAMNIDDKYIEIMKKNNIPYLEIDNVDACDFIVKYLIENHLI